jgi:hypothetical protein
MTAKQLTPATKRKIAVPRLVLSTWASAKIVASSIVDDGRAGAQLVLGCETGGAEGDRTPDLGIANAALSQLSYCPFRTKRGM